MPRSRDDSDSSTFDSSTFENSSVDSTTGWNVRSKGEHSLADLCTDAFMLIFHIHGGSDPGHPDDVRKIVGILFQELEKKGKRQGYGEEDIKATRYALCALIDETILNSRWSFKDQWAARPLQLEYFGDQMAGERFFDLLERVRQKGRKKWELLEVFSFVLILGFQGKYKLRGGEELAQLVRGLVDEVNGYREGASGLSPHWRIPEESVERPVQKTPRWIWITGTAAILTVVVVYLVFKFWLGAEASEAVTLMRLI